MNPGKVVKEEVRVSVTPQRTWSGKWTKGGPWEHRLPREGVS